MLVVGGSSKLGLGLGAISHLKVHSVMRQRVNAADYLNEAHGPATLAITPTPLPPSPKNQQMTNERKTGEILTGKSIFKCSRCSRWCVAAQADLEVRWSGANQGMLNLFVLVHG
eukprot:scaffold171659_cov33-Tisochrysis_lutea.AAC.2